MAEFIEPIGVGLALLLGMPLLFMAAGVFISQVISIIPGLGGVFAVVMLLPLTFAMEPRNAIAMLVGAAVTSGTGNTVTGVLFGVPGSPTGAAVVFDGYPMAQQGRAARAIGAGITASVVGGVLGAILLGMMIPFARALALLMGPPEFFVVIVASLIFMVYVGTANPLKGLVAGGLGLLLSFIGQEGSTGTLRYTFDQLYLWDGIQLAPLMIGLFAIAEMAKLHVSGSAIAGDAEQSEAESREARTIEGVLDVFRHWKVTARSSVVGVVTGLVPGLGGETAQLLAYGQEARGRRGTDKIPFGEGAVEGVIAADAPTNSKDGGALIPTLAFGIPGSAVMAVLLFAFTTYGIRPGPRMFVESLDIVWLIVWVLLLSNIVAACIVLSITRYLALLTKLRPTMLVPPIVAVSVFGAFATTGHIGDVYTALLAGIGGYYMSKHGYSRVIFIIGLVLGSAFEQNYLLATNLFGWRFILRAPSLAIIGVMVLPVIVGALRKHFRDRPQPAVPDALAEMQKRQQGDD